MGKIKNVETGEERLLPEHAVLGRAPNCDIHLRQAKASSEHAVLRWTDESWRIIDLSSRNGTWIAGRRLETGESAKLEAGAAVSFGTLGETWQLIAADEPVPFVRGAGRDIPIINGQLALPDDGDPQLIISRGVEGEWFAEHDGEPQVVVDRELLHGAGSWRLFLTSLVPQTEIENELMSSAAVLIHHDRTEECIKVTLIPSAGPPVDLGIRAHHVVLLDLARVRLEERARGIAVAQEGWIHRDELSARLALDVKHVNIMIYRLRRQLADMGVLEFTNIIERRPRLGTLRLGSAAVRVVGEM